MADVIFVAVVVAFFALAAAYVRGCAAIIGPDPAGTGADADDGADEPEPLIEAAR